MRVLCLLILLMLAGAVAVFAFQKQEVIQLRFFDWSDSYSLASLVGIVYLVGMVSGGTVIGLVRRWFRRITDDPAR